MEKVEEISSWNKKRIFIAIFLLALLITGGYFFKTKILVGSSQQAKLVKGISTQVKTAEPEFKINVQEAVREKINSLKEQVSGLNMLEIASSSPQVRKILNDIKSLEQYPVNQAQEICKKICGL